MQLLNQLNFKILILLSFIFSNDILFSQSKEIKLIGKQKFQKLERKLDKNLKKDSLNCMSWYFKGILLNQQNYSKHSPEQAVVCFNKSLDEFFKLGIKAREKYIKYGIISDSIRFHRNISFNLGLETAKKKNTISSYDYFITTYKDAQSQKREAIFLRDSLAFNHAKSTNSVGSFDYFIENYPNSSFLSVAITNRDNLAFEIAQKVNTEEAYVNFLSKYPQSHRKQEAIMLRDKQAFAEAKKGNRSSVITNFLKKYPDTHLKEEATFELNRLYFQEQTDGTVAGYITFCNKNGKSNFYNQAIDSIWVLSIKNFDVEGAQYLLKNHRNEINISSFQDELIDAFLFDGDQYTLSAFISNFEDYLDKNHLSKLETYSEMISLVRSLFLKIGITSNNENEYVEFIKSMAPSDIAFVALQRLIEKDLNVGNWLNAKTKLQEFEKIFQKQNFNPVTNLITILDKPDMLVKKEQIKGVNSVNEEYAPVPSIDGKKLFFCGKDRKDNIGGEDVFIATIGPKQVIESKLVESLSTPYGNEAPLSVSADGTTIFLYSNENSGDIMVSKIEKSGTWSTPVALPYPINTDFMKAMLCFLLMVKPCILLVPDPVVKICIQKIQILILETIITQQTFI